MVTGRDAQLAEARELAEAYYEAVLTEDGLEAADTRGWSWTPSGRLFVTGLISRLAEARCAHLDGVVPMPAFGASWAPGLACVACAGPGGEAGFDFDPVKDARCAACSARGVVLQARQILRGVYVLAVLLCADCEAVCHDG